jgi:hypothetical protein
MPQKVLIVDDEKDFLDIIAERILARGMDVSTATSAEDALNMVEEESFDVIILDFMMPALDGFKALKLIKASQSTRGSGCDRKTTRSERPYSKNKKSEKGSTDGSWEKGSQAKIECGNMRMIWVARLPGKIRYFSEFSGLNLPDTDQPKTVIYDF